MGQKFFNVYPLFDYVHKINVLMADIRQQRLPNRWLRMQRSRLKVIRIPKSKMKQKPKSRITGHHGRGSQGVNERLCSLKNITRRRLYCLAGGNCIAQLSPKSKESNLGGTRQKGAEIRNGENKREPNPSLTPGSEPGPELRHKQGSPQGQLGQSMRTPHHGEPKM